jgi:hypothetical protein
VDQYWRGRSSIVLSGFMLLALVYGGLLLTLSPFTDEIPIDGAIGVILGLYVCSHPAANVLDLLFSDGGASRQRSSDERGIIWYALNLLVLMAGWFAVWVGLTRFTT